MASYTNIKDILKQFELQIVQQKHYTKDQVDNAISNAIANVDQMHIVICSNASNTPQLVVVPTRNAGTDNEITGWTGSLKANKADSHTIYYAYNNNGDLDKYDEYMAINGVWEKIGDTGIDLSGYVPTTRTVNGHALSANVTVSKSDVGLGNVTNVATTSTITNGNDKDKNITSGAVYSALNATLTESSSKGVKLGGKVNAPTVSVVPGIIESGDASVITGGAVFNYAQPKDADLTAIAALTGTSGLLKKTAENTWSLDNSSYLTTDTASSTYTAKTKSYSSTSAGVKLGGTSETPTITVTGGSIVSGNTSVVTGGTVYNYAQPLDDNLTTIARLGNVSTNAGFLKKVATGGGGWAFDNTTYLTASDVIGSNGYLYISDSDFTTMLSEV